jgi:MFS family permease
MAGRTLGSRLARRHDPARLIALALAVTAVGFAILWPSTAPTQALLGLVLLGIGLGNPFPMGVSVAVARVRTEVRWKSVSEEHQQDTSTRSHVSSLNLVGSDDFRGPGSLCVPSLPA